MIDDYTPYIIVAPPYMNASGGIRCLYLLAEHLLKKGFPAYVLSGGSIRLNGNEIVVYPETYSGNPLNLKTVVRYVLNFPGLIGGDKTYDPKEIIFTYSQRYYPGAPLLTIPIIEEFFRDYGLPRSGGCFWVGKCSNVPRIPETEGLTEITYQWPETRQELAHLLNTKEVFYSYDPNTALIPEAQRCGCRTVTINKENVGLDTYDNNVVNFESQLDNFIKITQEAAKK